MPPPCQPVYTRAVTFPKLGFAACHFAQAFPVLTGSTFRAPHTCPNSSLADPLLCALCKKHRYFMPKTSLVGSHHGHSIMLLALDSQPPSTGCLQ